MVRTGDKTVYAETLPSPNQARVFTAAQSADLNHAPSRSSPLPATMDLATRTGTWEFNNSPGQNAHAWSVGYTTGLAMAVWVGNRTQDQPLLDRAGNTIWGTGLPTVILRAFMANAHRALGVQPQVFPATAFGGRTDPPPSVSR